MFGCLYTIYNKIKTKRNISRNIHNVSTVARITFCGNERNQISYILFYCEDCWNQNKREKGFFSSEDIFSKTPTQSMARWRIDIFLSFYFDFEFLSMIIYFIFNVHDKLLASPLKIKDFLSEFLLSISSLYSKLRIKRKNVPLLAFPL